MPPVIGDTTGDLRTPRGFAGWNVAFPNLATLTEASEEEEVEEEVEEEEAQHQRPPSTPMTPTSRVVADAREFLRECDATSTTPPLPPDVHGSEEIEAELRIANELAKALNRFLLKDDAKDKEESATRGGSVTDVDGVQLDGNNDRKIEQSESRLDVTREDCGQPTEQFEGLTGEDTCGYFDDAILSGDDNDHHLRQFEERNEYTYEDEPEEAHDPRMQRSKHNEGNWEAPANYGGGFPVQTQYSEQGGRDWQAPPNDNDIGPKDSMDDWEAQANDDDGFPIQTQHPEHSDKASDDGGVSDVSNQMHHSELANDDNGFLFPVNFKDNVSSGGFGALAEDPAKEKDKDISFRAFEPSPHRSDMASTTFFPPSFKQEHQPPATNTLLGSTRSSRPKKSKLVVPTSFAGASAGARPLPKLKIHIGGAPSFDGPGEDDRSTAASEGSVFFAARRSPICGDETSLFGGGDNSSSVASPSVGAMALDGLAGVGNNHHHHRGAGGGVVAGSALGAVTGVLRPLLMVRVSHVARLLRTPTFGSSYSRCDDVVVAAALCLSSYSPGIAKLLIVWTMAAPPARCRCATGEDIAERGWNCRRRPR